MYAPPPKKSRSGLIIGLVALAVVVCCALPIGGFAYFANMFVTKGKGFIGCTVSLKPLQSAFRAYAKDHKGKLPAGKSWEDDLRSYYKKELARTELGPWKAFPVEGPWGCTEEKGQTGFAFNADIAGKDLNSIKDPDAVLLFEVPKAGKNLAQPYKAQSYESSPAMFGGMADHRGWFVLPLEGNPEILGKKGQRVPINTSGNTVQIKTGD